MESVRGTGMDALDTFLGGGLPAGFTTLLLTPSGAGGEIFAKQFAADHPGEKVAYITTDESEAEVLATVRLSGWNFEEVGIIDVQTMFADAMLDNQQTQRDASQSVLENPSQRKFNPRDLVEGTNSLDLLKRRRKEGPSGRPSTDYLGMILDPFRRLRAPDRTVIHSLDFFLNLYSVEEVVATLTAIKAANAKQGGEMLWVLSKGAHGATTERRLELLADCLIELEMTRKGTTFERFCMVKKVKNRSTGVGVSTYQITPQGFHLETLERIV